MVVFWGTGLESGSKLLSEPTEIIIWPGLGFLRGGNCYGGRNRKGGVSMWLGTLNVSRVGPGKSKCKVLFSGCK